jgi:hypothetical protein
MENRGDIKGSFVSPSTDSAPAFSQTLIIPSDAFAAHALWLATAQTEWAARFRKRKVL